MGLVNDHHANTVQFNGLFLKSVVEGFHHSYETLIRFLVRQFLDFAIDDFIVNPETFKHSGSLKAEFNPVGKDDYLFSGLGYIPLCDFRKNNGFPTPCRQLVQQVDVGRRLLQYPKNLIQILELIIVKRFF